MINSSAVRMGKVMLFLGLFPEIKGLCNLTNRIHLNDLQRD